jgi:hypothetical protein
MINVSGAVIKSIKTMADKSVVVTIDFGELVKLGSFDGLLQMPLTVVVVTEETMNEVAQLNED